MILEKINGEKRHGKRFGVKQRWRSSVRRDYQSPGALGTTSLYEPRYPSLMSIIQRCCASNRGGYGSLTIHVVCVGNFKSDLISSAGCTAITPWT